MRHATPWTVGALVVWAAVGPGAAGTTSLPGAADLKSIPANTWTLLHEEDAAGGKVFARLVAAESVGRLYLWGLGGTLLDRNRYAQYELESFQVPGGPWTEAFPAARRTVWTDRRWPPFRLYGQGGTEGPRIHTVGGSGAINRVFFHDFEGVQRPSPVLTFNQAAWDSKRHRIVYFSFGKTFALDPATDTWTDLKPEMSPTACQPLAWGSLVYDAVNDEMLLFGGGLALNPEGGARTWAYDCARNTWYRPTLALEPPLRCTAPIVFDPKTETMVLFGGYDQTRALNDTWVYRCRDRRWEKRQPNPSPPPMFDPAAAAVPGGGAVLVVGPSGILGTRTHEATWTNKETWVYDIAGDAWRPAGQDFPLPGTRWLTADGSTKEGVIFLAAFGQKRRTHAFRYDPAGPAAKRAGSPPDTVWYKFADQKASLEEAPAADPEVHARVRGSPHPRMPLCASSCGSERRPTPSFAASTRLGIRGRVGARDLNTLFRTGLNLDIRFARPLPCHWRGW